MWSVRVGSPWSVRACASTLDRAEQTVADRELVPANFQTAGRIEAFIEEKTHAA
jgi:hypothetical protein